MSVGFGFQISGLRFQIVGFGFRGMNLGFQGLGFGFRVSGFGIQVSGFGLRVSGVLPAGQTHTFSRADFGNITWFWAQGFFAPGQKSTAEHLSCISKRETTFTQVTVDYRESGEDQAHERRRVNQHRSACEGGRVRGGCLYNTAAYTRILCTTHEWIAMVWREGGCSTPHSGLHQDFVWTVSIPATPSNSLAWKQLGVL